MRITYIGNFEPEHSTENDVRRTLDGLGHRVVALQENQRVGWEALVHDLAVGAAPDLIMWTRTWHLPELPQREMLEAAMLAGVPTVGFHLDRWWGLGRESQIDTEPFFRCSLLATADGGHDEQWEAAGVRHVWSPPAVLEASCLDRGEYRADFDVDVAFVGSVRYHGEWPHRERLLTWLSRTYRRRFGRWPRAGAVRGKDLADLYATARVIVGDSCLAGDATRYWSDRIPETLGRGGFLIHPHVDGMEQHYTDGVHLRTWRIGAWDSLRETIDYYLRNPDERAAIAEAGRAHVLATATYTQRLAWLLRYVEDRRRDLATPLRERVGPVSLRRQGVEARFVLREGKYDGIAVDETWRENVYRLDPADVRGRVVVDLGANVGAFSVWAAKAGAALVHAYEPEPTLRAALCDNLCLNGITDEQVLVYGEAVGERSGHAFSVLGESGYEGGSYVHAWDEIAGEGVEVPVVDLNTVLLRAGSGLIVKVDIEGSEYGVIRGVEPGHLRRADRIVMEFHGREMPNTPAERAKPQPSEFGEMVRVLAEDGHVETLGRPTLGGTLWWRRYGS